MAESEATGFRPEVLEKAIHLLNLLTVFQRHPALGSRLALKGGTALNLFCFDLPRDVAADVARSDDDDSHKSFFWRKLKHLWQISYNDAPGNTAAPGGNLMSHGVLFSQSTEEAQMGNFLIVLPVLALAAHGHGSGPVLENLLPDQPGFEWTYWGFAEYGHRMRIDSVEETETGRIYRISGMVEDVSDGEAPGDYSLTLWYVVSDSVLSVVQHAQRTMDNDFEEMELLRLPLATGNRWVQTVVDASGAEVELVCEIEEMEEGRLTVRYSRTDSPFYQLREFEEGLGVTRFAKLYIFAEGSFEMDYLLYRGKY